ncbi:MAG TPA: hypothetical protein VN397_01720 [Candidatus Methylomirabilis sp.]|nr:hypothetical protein [Candidatus Methylomirabilis sp.]
MATPAEDALLRAINRAIANIGVWSDDTNLELRIHPVWVEYICDLITSKAPNSDIVPATLHFFRSLPPDEQRRLYANGDHSLEEFAALIREGRDLFVKVVCAQPKGDA